MTIEEKIEERMSCVEARLSRLEVMITDIHRWTIGLEGMTPERYEVYCKETGIEIDKVRPKWRYDYTVRG